MCDNGPHPNPVGFPIAHLHSGDAQPEAQPLLRLQGAPGQPDLDTSPGASIVRRAPNGVHDPNGPAPSGEGSGPGRQVMSLSNQSVSGNRLPQEYGMADGDGDVPM